MTLCLLAICLACSALLAVVYVLTEEPIAQAQKAKNEAAIKEVLPPEAATIMPEESISLDNKSYTYNFACNEDGEIIGCAINVAPVGFGGPISIKVGFNADGVIWNTKVLSHAETPGLGAKCTEPSFADQFKNVDPDSTVLKVSKDGGVINAITASTITSRAYAAGVEEAVKVYEAILNQDEK